MADRDKPAARTHLETPKQPVWWNWWSENPVEVVLLVFILVLFFALPRQGCGISQSADTPGQPPANTQGSP